MNTRKKTFLLFLLVFFAGYTFMSAQSEYRFISVRLGLNHNAFSPKPEAAPYHFGNTPISNIGDLKLEVADRYIDYNVGFLADIYYHFDFQNDKVGIVAGAEFANNSVSTKYVSPLHDYEVVDRFKMYSVGVPLMVKVGENIYRDQFYFFAGGQFNYNLKMVEVQRPSWTDHVAERELQSDEMATYNYSFFIGVNYLVFNLQLDFMPNTLFNTDFQQAEAVNPNEKLLIYENQPKFLMAVKTSIHIPLSEWLVIKSWEAEKIRRMIPGN